MRQKTLYRLINTISQELIKILQKALNHTFALYQHHKHIAGYPPRQCYALHGIDTAQNDNILVQLHLLILGRLHEHAENLHRQLIYYIAPCY